MFILVIVWVPFSYLSDSISHLMVWCLETLMLENKCNFEAFLGSVLASVL